MRLMLISLVLLMGLGPGLLAHGEEPHGAKGGKQRITGEIVDTACYIGSGERGLSHQACAQRCIQGGLPVAILDDKTNKLYLIINARHEPANDLLADLGAETVTLEGTVSERNGVLMLSIVDAPAPQTRSSKR